MSKNSLPRYPPCFVCGRSNPLGLDVTFHRDGLTVLAEVTGRHEHTGYPEVIHGGIIAALLDEAMGWAVTLANGLMVETWELTVRYRRRLPPGKRIRVVARLSEDRRRYQLSEGRVEGPDGEHYAQGQGKYRPIPPGDQETIWRLLEKPDGSPGFHRDDLGPFPGASP